MAHGLPTPAAPGLSEDQARGLALACSSAVFIGSSFIIKKKGLRVAGASGTRAGALAGCFAQSPSPLSCLQCESLRCYHLCFQLSAIAAGLGRKAASSLRS